MNVKKSYENRKLYALHLREKHWPRSMEGDFTPTDKIYLFHRHEGFYPLKFSSDNEACRDAKLNPGTIRVETEDGRIVWPDNL